MGHRQIKTLSVCVCLFVCFVEEVFSTTNFICSIVRKSLKTFFLLAGLFNNKELLQDAACFAEEKLFPISCFFAAAAANPRESFSFLASEK